MDDKVNPVQESLVFGDTLSQLTKDVVVICIPEHLDPQEQSPRIHEDEVEPSLPRFMSGAWEKQVEKKVVPNVVGIPSKIRLFGHACGNHVEKVHKYEGQHSISLLSMREVRVKNVILGEQTFLFKTGSIGLIFRREGT